MISPVGGTVSQVHSVQNSHSGHHKQPERTASEATAAPAAQTPSSAQASQVVPAIQDSDNGRGADLQPALNQAPSADRAPVQSDTANGRAGGGNGTAGINTKAVEVLNSVLEATKQADSGGAQDFRAELHTQLEAAGLNAQDPIVDIRR